MDSYILGLIERLSGCITENRLALFKQILSNRTRYITILLEDIFQSQNASAVLRTCDCAGLQDVHIVEDLNKYEINPDVALGSDKWLTLNYYSHGQAGLSEAVKTLRYSGYRIVATSPHAGGTSPDTFDIDKGKAALMFGTELNGLSERALEFADVHIQIPMKGFTESYNISASAAIILYRLRERLEASPVNWRIGEKEQTEILLDWLRTSVKMSEQIESQFQKDYNPIF